MKIAEIAEAFGMRIGDFANYTGYSRQALYDFESTGRNRARGKATIQLLEMKSQQILAADKEMAEFKFRVRENAIKELEKMLVKDGET